MPSSICHEDPLLRNVATITVLETNLSSRCIRASIYGDTFAGVQNRGNSRVSIEHPFLVAESMAGKHLQISGYVAIINIKAEAINIRLNLCLYAQKGGFQSKFSVPVSFDCLQLAKILLWKLEVCTWMFVHSLQFGMAIKFERRTIE